MPEPNGQLEKWSPLPDVYRMLDSLDLQCRRFAKDNGRHARKSAIRP
jgi:hypothetical protein